MNTSNIPLPQENHTNYNNLTLNPIINFPSLHPYIKYQSEESLFLQQSHNLLQQLPFFTTTTGLLPESGSEKMAAGDEKCTKKIVSAKKKYKHTKINTADGPRDRRMRLSINVASRFFGLQDMLGHKKPSETLEWLLTKSVSAIKQLQNYNAYHYDCEIFSGFDEPSPAPATTRSTSRKEKKKKKKKMVISSNGFGCKISSGLFKRELREKARERARERTKEKNILKRINNTNGNYEEFNKQQGLSSSTTTTCGQGIMDMDVDVDLSELGFLENMGEDQEIEEEDMTNFFIRDNNWPDHPFFNYQLPSSSAQSSNLS